MLKEKDIKTLLTKYTKPKLLAEIRDEVSTDDLRTNILLSHLWAERFMEGIIIKKFKNHTEINQFDFSRKRKILFGLGIINNDWNQDLKILNYIRVEYAHEIQPNKEIAIKLIKKFKSYPDIKISKENQLVNDMMKFGWLTIHLLHYLMEVFWDINSEKK